MNSNDDIKVSIVCTTYNHDKYISRTIHSFLDQKTNFNYEIIIHDDASVDNTVNILRVFEKKHKPTIKVLYEKENQYKLGRAIIDEIMLPIAKGKYIAFCEGDDFWCDSQKLQKQFDYMEAHPECSLCAHNTLLHHLSGNAKDYKFHNWHKIHKMTEREVFMKWKIHTSSFFFKKEFAYRERYSRKYWFGDYVRVTSAFSKGEIMVFPEIMSVYNYGVETGLLQSYENSQTKRIKLLDRKKYLLEYNSKTEYRFDSIITERCKQLDFEADTYEERYIISYSKEKKDVIAAAERIVSLDSYREYISVLSIFRKVIELIRYRGYFFYFVWKGLWK